MASVHRDMDGGFAWFILAACIIMTCFEHSATTGIFYMAILEKYQRSHYETIWIQTLHSQKELAHWTVHVTVQIYACCFSG